MKKLFLFLFASIFFLNAIAINEEQALLVAQNFLKEKNMNEYSSLFNISIQETIKNEGTTVYYILQLGANEGFLIVSASEYVPPIIGYSFDSEFEWHPSIQFYLDSYSNFIVSEEKSKSKPDIDVSKQWDRYLQEKFIPEVVIMNEILPLVTSRWNQNRFYNTYCPWDSEAGSGKDYRTYNGCVALAAAQLMNYYRHPERGKNAVSYKPSIYPWQTVFFSQHQYHWDAMCDRATAYTNEIAKLAYHVGVSCQMGYGPNGSGAYTKNVANALREYFYYTDHQQWAGNDALRMKECLNLLQPILMSGSNGTSGHAYLVDGYYETIINDLPETMFHFNWGWGGASDGYYTLRTHDFWYDATVFLNIRPATNYPVQCQQYKKQTAFQGYITNGSTNQPYQSNPDCSWIIAAPGASHYSFTFSRLDTKENIDLVTIYQGATKSSGIAAQYSGTDLPKQSTTVYADSVLITFTSTDPWYENTSHLGFLMNYVANKPPQKCDGVSNLSATSGYITDGSAKEENYTPWVSCTWNIAPEHITGFYGLFHEFDLRLGDFFDIFDATKTPPNLWRRYDRYAPPTIGEVISLPFSKAKIQFITDNFDEGEGFKFQYFSLLSINDHSLLDNLSIYPNPASEFINIAFTSKLTNQAITCRMIDLAGKEVYTTVFDYTDDLFTAQIPVAHLSKGFYFLQLVTKSGISTSKIIIN